MKTYSRLAAAAAFLCLLSGCASWFYHPSNIKALTPADVRLASDEVVIDGSGEPKLRAWFLPAQGSAKATVVFLHGNAGNISSHLPSVYWLPPFGFNVLIFDYRGYGGSAGEPEIDGMHRDVERAVEYAKSRPDVDSQNLFLYGQSLGATMALYTAERHSADNLFRGVVAESPFESYGRIAQEKASETWLTWPFQLLPRIFISSKYDPVDNLEKLRGIPLLLVSGDKDIIVPLRHSQAIAGRIGGSAELWIYTGLGHLEIFNRTESRERLAKWLAEKAAR